MNSKLKVVLIGLVVISIAGCNGLGKMSKNFPTVKHEVVPNPLELHGDSVAISIKGTYPPKYFAKKVDATATPMIKSSSAEHNFKSVTTVGEKSVTNGTKINYKAGGSFTYSDRIAYTDDMRAGDVVVKVTGMKGKKTKELGSVKIADGTIITPRLVQHDEKTITGKDNYQRIIPANFDGVMYYLINTATVNQNFKNAACGFNNKGEFARIDSAYKTLSLAPYVIKGVSIMGNASPDGTERVNADLATNRGKASIKWFSDMLKKSKIKISPDSSFFSMSTTNEDWAGFKTLMQNSSTPQRDMILRVVASNSDPEAREMEIRNMGKVYDEIAEGVLPKLRRSTVTINADKVGRSDEQILATAKTSPDSLSLEEIVRAGSLAENASDKLSIYRAAERIYPQDWRCSNNLGTVLFGNGDIDGAMAAFSKADQLSANNPIIKNNIGACQSRKDDRKAAATSYASATGAGPEVKTNMAILDIRSGNYSTAVSNLSGAGSFNEALAKLLSGDKDGAMSVISSSKEGSTAMGEYLKAIISARKGDANGVIKHLTASISKEANMKAKAAADREFIKWYNDPAFQSVVK
ncbi:MAG: tetratricopeptide repeat protein [Bacteroidota bacterium]